ncbi:MAG: hypothetical protein EZS28_038668 [Streblomastix strix]|uniref:Uncharacterized protein n=1 Tax=Streblomastix strix TaxID=222440 RepID=A0A5J4U4V0_9EUKA|nr:MAG: hypothetical protein EZS28_038668 [Streblomastix strix]
MTAFFAYKTREVYNTASKFKGIAFGKITPSLIMSTKHDKAIRRGKSGRGRGNYPQRSLSIEEFSQFKGRAFRVNSLDVVGKHREKMNQTHEAKNIRTQGQKIMQQINKEDYGLQKIRLGTVKGTLQNGTNRQPSRIANTNELDDIHTYILSILPWQSCWRTQCVPYIHIQQPNVQLYCHAVWGLISLQGFLQDSETGDRRNNKQIEIENNGVCA